LTTEPVDEQLAAYRASIDNIDAALVHLLAERFKITKAVGRHKASIGLPAMDPAREDQQVSRLRALAAESGLDPVFTEAFLRFILSEVIRHHEELASDDVAVSPADFRTDLSNNQHEKAGRTDR
jgi:chorismate mutase